MKKNTMMRLAAVMLMCVLLTTSVVGGTFAKYVTSDLEQDKARVAKWGVNVEVVVDGAFAEEYAAKEGADYASTIAKTVVTSTTDKDNLVAPGTNGDLLKKATISGTPEVAVNVKKEATLTLTGWEVDGTYYCPITIKVTHKDRNGTENTQIFYGMNYISETDPVEAFTTAVEAALNGNDNLPANSDLEETYSVTWEWAFVGTDGKQTDENDTALGDKAAKTSDITIQFEYKITVTQLD